MLVCFRTSSWLLRSQETTNQPDINPTLMMPVCNTPSNIVPNTTTTPSRGQNQNNLAPESISYSVMNEERERYLQEVRALLRSESERLSKRIDLSLRLSAPGVKLSKVDHAGQPASQQLTRSFSQGDLRLIDRHSVANRAKRRRKRHLKREPSVTLPSSPIDTVLTKKNKKKHSWMMQPLGIKECVSLQ